jgi:hypothetical protein
VSGMRHNGDSFARFIGGAVKLSAPDAAVGTMGATGEVTLANGQVFEFTVRELGTAEAESGGLDPANHPANRPDGHGHP